MKTKTGFIVSNLYLEHSDQDWTTEKPYTLELNNIMIAHLCKLAHLEPQTEYTNKDVKTILDKLRIISTSMEYSDDDYKGRKYDPES